MGSMAGREGIVLGFVLPPLNLMVSEITAVKWRWWELSSSPAKPSGEKPRWEISTVKGNILESLGLWKQ